MEPISQNTLDAFFASDATGSLLFLALFGTIVAFTIYLVLLRKWGTMRAGLYAFVSPIVALGTGVWFFGEAIGWVEIAGAALMLAAAAMTLLRPREKSTSDEAFAQYGTMAAPTSPHRWESGARLRQYD